MITSENSRESVYEIMPQGPDLVVEAAGPTVPLVVAGAGVAVATVVGTVAAGAGACGSVLVADSSAVPHELATSAVTRTQRIRRIMP